MKFYIRKYRERHPDLKNILVLTSNTWNDYGTVSLFTLGYVDESGDYREIGETKILSTTDAEKRPLTVNSVTSFSKPFSALDNRFISLGQTEGYYSNIYEFLPKEMRSELLVALRDIAWDPELAHPFEPTSEFRNSLLRVNEAQYARRVGKELAEGRPVRRSFSFGYTASIPGADTPTEVEIQFDSADKLPGRIVCIVGRNAVGKTRFLANLATDLVQTRKVSRVRVAEMEGRFKGKQRPLFTRVLAVSFSAFDRFTLPQSEGSSYVYCGIRTDRGQLSRRDLVQRYRANLGRIRDGKRQTEWQRSMMRILGTIDDELFDKLGAEVDDPEAPTDTLSLLSSGQSILAHFVTALLAWIEPNSIVLFDEPETHLHPNAVAFLFNVLTSILETHDSFAVIATHSPVVLQEIPRKRAIVFEREGNTTTARPLWLESFGESISELTRHVFETNEIPTLYRRVLRSLANEESLEQTMDRFEEGLSMNAQAYLIAQHNR